MKAETRTKNIIIRIFLLVLFLSASSDLFSFAESEGPKAVELGTVVVTANRVERSLGETSSATEVIDQPDLENSPFEKVEDILRSEAGVDVNYHYGMNSVSGNRPVNLRGVGSFGGERTLVLIDGIPHNNPYTNWVEWSQIPKEMIEKIEIVRGPSSALYGSSGMGGVINIITKNPQKSSLTTLEGKGGNMSTWGTRVTQENKFKKWGILLNGKYETTNGYIAITPENKYDIERFRDDKNMFGKIVYRPEEGSVFAVGYSRYDSDRGCGREFSYETDKDNFGWLTFDKTDDLINWKAKFFVKDLNWRSYYDAMPFFNYLYHRMETPIIGIGGSLQSNINFSNTNSLTLGMDYLHNEFKEDDQYFTVSRLSQAQGKQFSVSPFIDEQLKFFSERLIFNLGARLDWIKAYDGENRDNGATPAYANYFSSKDWQELSPKVGALYKLNDSAIIRASVGNGFRAPSLYEMFVSVFHGPTYVECNPELQPEKMISYDLGLEYIFKSLLAKITVYQSYAKDFIGSDVITATHFRNENISKVDIRGLETELSLKINKSLSAFFNYTFNQSEIKKYSSDSSVEGNRLPWAPHQNIGLGFTYDNPKLFEFTALMDYKDKRFADNQNSLKLESYYTINFSLAKKIGEHVKIILDLENAFDEEYTIYNSAMEHLLAPGRVISGTLRYEF